jgi:hypothetical protein
MAKQTPACGGLDGTQRYVPKQASRSGFAQLPERPGLRKHVDDAVEQGDEADEAFGGMVARMDMPPHARAARNGRGHRFAAYPRCSADQRRHVTYFGCVYEVHGQGIAAAQRLTSAEPPLSGAAGTNAEGLGWPAELGYGHRVRRCYGHRARRRISASLAKARRSRSGVGWQDQVLLGWVATEERGQRTAGRRTRG